MDELSGMDLEELKKSVSNPKYGLFDGMMVEPKDDAFDKERLSSLMVLSNKSYRDLSMIFDNAKSEFKNGKRR